MTQTLLTLAEIEALARAAHSAQTDKAGRPYAEHLQAVADGVRERGGDDEQLAAAWLHDAVEDDVLSEDWLREAALPARTRDIVLALTKREGEPPGVVREAHPYDSGALLVKASDLAHNGDPARLAVLDEHTCARLTKKYAAMRALLGLPPN